MLVTNCEKEAHVDRFGGWSKYYFHIHRILNMFLLLAGYRENQRPPKQWVSNSFLAETVVLNYVPV